MFRPAGCIIHSILVEHEKHKKKKKQHKIKQYKGMKPNKIKRRRIGTDKDLLAVRPQWWKKGNSL